MTYLLIAIVALYYVLLVRSHVRPYLLLRVKSNHMKYLPMAALLVTLPLTVLGSSPPAQAQIRLGIEFPVLGGPDIGGNAEPGGGDAARGTFARAVGDQAIARIRGTEEVPDRVLLKLFEIVPLGDGSLM
jgi:hypothetical protein